MASPDEPHVALILELDVSLLRRLVDDLDGAALRDGDARPGALRVGAIDPELVAFRRLFSLADRPVEAAALAPLVIQEIHFRLLVAEHGAVLRPLLHRNSHASRIAAAGSPVARSPRAPRSWRSTVTDVALVVGYRSPTQFSREYSRTFGTPPSGDLWWSAAARVAASRDRD